MIVIWQPHVLTYKCTTSFFSIYMFITWQSHVLYLVFSHICSYTPLPDAILQRAASSQLSHSSLDPRQQIYGGLMTPYPGAMSVTPGNMTPGFATSSRIDLNQIGEARNSMLSIKLDQVCLFICLFVYLFVYLFVCLFVCLFICLFVCLFICLFICLFVCLFICLFFYLFIYLFIWLFLFVFVCLFL